MGETIPRLKSQPHFTIGSKEWLIQQIPALKKKEEVLVSKKKIEKILELAWSSSFISLKILLFRKKGGQILHLTNVKKNWKKPVDKEKKGSKYCLTITGNNYQQESCAWQLYMKYTCIYIKDKKREQACTDKQQIEDFEEEKKIEEEKGISVGTELTWSFCRVVKKEK